MTPTPTPSEGSEVLRLQLLCSVLVEALKLADAALSGANMNMRVVELAVRQALAQADPTGLSLSGRG